MGTPQTPKALFWFISQGFKAREPFQRLRSHILLLVVGLSAHSVRTLSIPDNFSVFYSTFVRHFWKMLSKIMPRSKKSVFLMKTKVVPLLILCRMRRVSTYGDLFLMVSWTFQIWGLGVPGGSNLCASRRRTLRGLFFAKKSVLKWEIVHLLDFNENVKILFM